MLIRLFLLMFLAGWCSNGARASVEFDFTIDPDCVTAEFMDCDSQLLQLPPGNMAAMPVVSSTFLLPPNTRVEEVTVNDPVWMPLPELTNPFIRGTENYPANPAGVVRQGSAMGYSVVSLYGYPLRYVSSTGMLEVLVSARIDIRTGPALCNALVPERESTLSGSLRQRAIENMVSNPEDLELYTATEVISFDNRNTPLNVTEFPSLQGDCADLVIVTREELLEPFQELAEYRTSHGIVTIVRTVEWIDEYYSGCDTQERIRNFLRDAHQNWGIQGVLLGGDAEIVPARYTGGWDYIPVPYPSYQLPADDYYGDLDGNWSYDGSVWRVYADLGYIDICTGRWPVNSPADVETLYEKLLCYETPQTIQGDFARRILLLGSNNPAGSGADDMALLAQMLDNSAVPEYIDSPVELFYPGDLNRNNALAQFDEGFNLIVHAGHSEIHKLGTAGNGTLGQFIWDSDFATMENKSMPSILWTLGCDNGHFDGAYCFSEAGLLTASDSGLLAAISNPRGGMHNQKTTAYFFCDALFNTGYTAEQRQSQSLDWPLTFLGEGFRMSKNLSGYSFMYLNLLGSPFLNVWRGNPEQLQVTTGTFFVTEGETQNITATVTSSGSPVSGATVILWKRNELFAVASTDEAGQVTFQDISPSSGGEDESILITGVKRRDAVNNIASTVSSYLPGTAIIDVLQSSDAVVSLAGFTLDPDGDGTANPGETAVVYISAVNTGGETAQDVSGELILVSGGEFISSIPDNTLELPDIPPDSSVISQDSFAVEISPNAPAGATVEFQVTFTYDGSQRESPLFLTVQSASYELTTLMPQADNSSGTTAVITLDELVLANSGTGADNLLAITVDNLFPWESFTVDTLTRGGIPVNSAEDVPGRIHLIVTPNSPDSPWLSNDFRECFFDVTVQTPSGVSIARQVSVEDVALYQNEELDPPENPLITEAGENTIALTWEHQGVPEAIGYYVYLNDSRVYPIPLPVKEIRIGDLEPGTEYEVQITSIDTMGRESIPVTIWASTGSPQVQGWPLQLNGSPGAGALTADLDGDGRDEIAVISSFGNVYLLERNGSYQKLSPPGEYDYDRFLGLAAGDVTGDGKIEIVCVCQRKIEAENQEQLSILLFRRPGSIWICEEIAVSQVNEELSSTMIGGTPLLFQADETPALEIALRTRGNNGGSPNLYVWRLEQSQRGWVDFSDDFPVVLNGGFFDTPSAADFDDDGLEELITTSYCLGEPGTELLVLDFEVGGDVIIEGHSLCQLNTEGYLARAFGTLAITEHSGMFYIAGVAKPESFCSSIKKLFVCTIGGTDSTQVNLLWQTDWIPGKDFYGNMPGPALANIDSDPLPEVLYLNNGGIYGSEGVVQGYNLTDGSVVFLSGTVPFCPVLGGGGADIKSQAVTGLTSFQGSGTTAVFAGFSSLCAGIDPLMSQNSVPGFPAYSRDAVWATPTVCDLDEDGHPELLYVDNSGCASLFDLSEYSTIENGWTMYQSNPRRTGFIQESSPPPTLDLMVVPGDNRISGETNRIAARVTISGAGETPDARSTELLSESLPIAETQVRFETAVDNMITLGVFQGAILTGTVRLPLKNGIFETGIDIAPGSISSQNLVLKIDPENHWEEIDETNNTCVCHLLTLEETAVIPSPSPSLSLHLTLPEALEGGIDVSVYSVDGRLIRHFETGELPPGITVLQLDQNQSLPSGMYAVRITGLGTEDTTRKIIILN